MRYGIPRKEFWHMNPAMLEPYKKESLRQLEERNFFCYTQGKYIFDAVSVVMHNSFAKKGTKPAEYPDKPYEIFKEPEDEHEPTEEEIIKARQDLINKLCSMQSSFEANKKR